jgi:peptidoglycan/xylan/chitin deacetylase (PgdA/CDA1 family)
MLKFAKNILIYLLVVVLIAASPSNISLATKYDFEGHWAEQTVKLWVEKGYLKMYEDGTFRPNEPVTRAEFVSMVNKLFQLTDVEHIDFLDIAEDDWFYEGIAIAVKAGYITGDGNKNFRPQEPITREEASTMLGRLIVNESSHQDDGTFSYTDVSLVSDFAKEYINFFVRHELIEGYYDKTLKPEQPLSRAEAVVLLDRVANLLDMNHTYYTNKVVVLMYHSVREDYEYDHCINKDVFYNHMKMLENSGFNVITLDTFISFMEGKSQVPDNAVLITFDDGYEDFYNLAYPVLKDRNLSATMFMITSTIGDKTGWNPKIDLQQMEEMTEYNIYFQSHSHNAHKYIEGSNGKEDAYLITRTFNENNLPETFEEYYDRVYHDLAKSKEVLDELLKQDTKVLAVPYGKANSTVYEIANSVGLDYNFTIKPGVVTKNIAKMSLPRINAGYSSITGEELKNIILRNVR